MIFIGCSLTPQAMGGRREQPLLMARRSVEASRSQPWASSSSGLPGRAQRVSAKAEGHRAISGKEAESLTVEFQILHLIKRTKYLFDEKKSSCWAGRKERQDQS